MIGCGPATVMVVCHVTDQVQMGFGVGMPVGLVFVPTPVESKYLKPTAAT